MLRNAGSLTRRGLACSLMVVVLAPAARAAGAFSATGSLAAARDQHIATLLGSGKVLVSGGDNGGALGSAELYDPGAGTWSATGSQVFVRERHTATLLANGRVLVAGGFGASSAVATAENYNPASGTWGATGNMTTAREQHTATLLGNGKVLVAGGLNGSAIASAELYDPNLGTWSSAGSFANARYQHTATRLANGKVLVVGGTNGGALTSAALYDPSLNAWSAAGSLATARRQHTATLLPSGKVLVVGGDNGGALASAELYDPSLNTWSATGSLVTARSQHTATLLNDGTVLVTGGVNGGALTSAELYDPATGNWTTTGSLVTGRDQHTATLLSDGKVLVAGGFNGGALTSAELYDPNVPDTTPPTVQVLSPNGGQVDNITTITVEWIASDNIGVDHVDIYLSTNGGSSFDLLAAGRPNSGSYDWDGAPLTTQGRIRVVAFDAAGNSATDDSDADFTVINSEPPATPSPFAGVFTGAPVQLHWGANTEPDFSVYHLHRGSTAAFLPAPGNLVVSQAHTGYVDSGSTWSYYKLSAVDVSGHESGFAAVVPAGSSTGSTPTGTNVPVAPLPIAQLTFQHVTGAGQTQLTLQTSGPPPPYGLKLVPVAPPLYYVLSTTATFTGTVTICLTYDPANVSGPESGLRLMHYDTALNPPVWAHVIASRDTAANLICGTVDHFSEFALMEADPAVDVGGTGTWSATGSLAAARTEHIATLLESGKVLVSGGDNGGALGSAELYDPGAGTWSATGSQVFVRERHTATLLANGRVLVAGGFGASSAVATAENYNPAAGTWGATGNMTTAREQHTATLLGNGKVLVAGGFNGSAIASAELYDPNLGTWSAAGSFANAHYQHTATRLANGKVLVVGGTNGSALTSAVLYDPTANTWSVAGSLATARAQHTATLLANGKVLVVGGDNGGALASVELYDPGSNTWSATGSLVTARSQHSATLLPNGVVLVAGGMNGSALASAELYDPATGTWSATSSLATTRAQHTATLLPNGDVLVAGGANGGALASAEIYRPDYLDSTPPATPSPFTAVFSGGPVQLHWGGNTEADFAVYHLHRGSTAGFVPAPGSLVVSQADTGYIDSGSTWSYYRLSALDGHGNESGFAVVAPGGSSSGSTPAGGNVQVSPSPIVGLTFQNVTGGGSTSLTLQTGGSPPPGGLKISPSAPPLYYVITTTATFTGTVTVCVNYAPEFITGQEKNLKLMHYDAAAQPPGWVQVTSSRDTAANLICGTVTHFSEFALMETDENVAVEEEMPSAFRLYACAPNPVSSSALIRFDLPVKSAVRLDLYDLAGRLVRELERSPMADAGRHSVQWDGRGAHEEPLRSGIYFLWLEAGGSRQMRRVAVIR